MFGKKKQKAADEEASKNRIRKAIETLKDYKAAKEALEQKLIDNEKWYKMQHWNLIRGKKANSAEPEPTTGYLFSTIANKHADAMDNYPEASMLPREPNDQQEAANLTSVVPVVIEQNEFKATYDKAWWYKIKHGFVVYAVLWDSSLNNGLGDISIKRIDALNIYWEPGIENIQDSRNVFVISLVASDILAQTYPDKIGEGFVGNKLLQPKEYEHDDNISSYTEKKCVVVDWYYKEIVNGKTILHLTKFVDDIELESTSTNEAFATTGLYEHGEYPFEIDVLFPEDGTPVGFGYIDITRNPQMYVDKLDQIITRNALRAGKQRYVIKDGGSINKEQLMDYSIDVIESKGSITEESFRIIQDKPLDPFIVQHRQFKKEELKETSGSNEFSRGESGAGITAASAIAMLQEAGNKLSRDMIQASYRTYTKIVYKCIELIRQFYDDARVFRIKGSSDEHQFITYSNAGIKQEQIPPMFEGAQATYRKSIFDIKVKPQKASPFSQLAANELAKELFGAGFFNPEQAQGALVALEMMSFEGKETIMKKVSENGMFFQQMQQMQQQLAAQQQLIQRMSQGLQKLTGEDLGVQNGAM